MMACMDVVQTQPSEFAGRPVAAALTIGLAALFLLCGYEFARGVSVSLFIDVYGTDRLPVVMAVSPIAILLFLCGYGWLLTRLGSRRALLISSLLSGAGIVVCYIAILQGSKLAVGALFVLREGYIVLLIEQYWSFINSTLTPAQARKLNGPICGIASVGAIGGGLLVGKLAVVLGSEQLLLFAAFSVLPAAGLAARAYRIGGEPIATETLTSRDFMGLQLFRRHRILVYLGLLIVATQVVSTVLDLRFSGLLERALPGKDERSAFLGNFWALLNTVALFLQFIAAPVLLSLLSFRQMQLAIPILHLLAAVALLLFPSLTVGAAAFLLFKAVDYSVFRAGKEIFYIPLPFDARYRSKEVIDAFGYRASKGGASALLALAGQVFGRLPGAVYPAVAITALAGWVTVVIGLTRSSAVSDK